MNDRDKLIYLAGIIDGEGCIGINAIKNNGCCNTRNFKVRLMVVNTDLRLICWLKENFGGSVSARNRKSFKKEWKDCYSWSIYCSQAGRLIALVYPYLIVKKQQAEIVIAYRKIQELNKTTHRGKRAVPLSLREEISACVKFLNHRGPKPVTTNTPNVSVLLTKIESELESNLKRRNGDVLSASLN